MNVGGQCRALPACSRGKAHPRALHRAGQGAYSCAIPFRAARDPPSDVG